MTSDPHANRKTLIAQAYASAEHLAVRYRTDEQYSRPAIHFQDWVLDVVDWSGDEWVLDISTGPGRYSEGVVARAPHGRYVAGDLSFDLARQARSSTAADFTVLNLDMQHLPFAGATFDVVLANHMLGQLPALHETLLEIRRVLRPDGLLIAATNGEGTLPELDTLTRRACALLGYPRHTFETDGAFSLERGPSLLGRYFRAVARYDLPGALYFPEVDPVLDYIDSTRSLREQQLPDDVAWEEFMSMMEKQITRLIRHFGELKVNKLVGVIVATNGGGFAREYLSRLDGRS